MPTIVARSITRSETGRPRSFSTSAQKMWPPSRGRIGSRLIEAEREADEGEQQQRPFEALFDHLVADVADPDHAGDLLALFGFEEVGEDVDGAGGDFPDRVAGFRGGGAGADLDRRSLP